MKYISERTFNNLCGIGAAIILAIMSCQILGWM